MKHACVKDGTQACTPACRGIKDHMRLMSQSGRKTGPYFVGVFVDGMCSSYNRGQCREGSSSA